MVQEIIILGIGVGAIITSLYFLLYFMYRNNQTYITLINIGNELNCEIQIANSKEDFEHIYSIFKKLCKKDRYASMLFSFKSFTQLDYELRKDIGMLNIK